MKFDTSGETHEFIENVFARVGARNQAILGRAAKIEQSETADQTISGEVDHYPAANGEGRVIFVNHAVFKAEFLPGTKS